MSRTSCAVEAGTSCLRQVGAHFRIDGVANVGLPSGLLLRRHRAAPFSLTRSTTAFVRVIPEAVVLDVPTPETHRAKSKPARWDAATLDPRRARWSSQTIGRRT